MRSIPQYLIFLMKSISLAIISFIIFLVALIAIDKIRSLRSARKSFTPILLSISLVPVYLLLYFTTPISLGVFPLELLSENLIVDVVNGLLLYTCLCVGFVDFLIGSAITPFSADILVEIYRSDDRGLSNEELKSKYCLDKSDRGLVQKRILFLRKIGFIRELAGGEYSVTKKAAVLAWVTQGLQRLSGSGK